jgi:hypothetical protein
MLKPIEKPNRQLVHHPTNALDDFCRYDASNRMWLEFDDSLSLQLIVFEYHNRRHIRAGMQLDRRSSF